MTCRLTALWRARILLPGSGDCDFRYYDTEYKPSPFTLIAETASLYSQALLQLQKPLLARGKIYGFNRRISCDKYARILSEEIHALQRVASAQFEMVPRRHRCRKCQNRSKSRRCRWKPRNGSIQCSLPETRSTCLYCHRLAYVIGAAKGFYFVVVIVFSETTNFHALTHVGILVAKRGSR